MRVVGYTRVSTEDQAQHGISPTEKVRDVVEDLEDAARDATDAASRLAFASTAVRLSALVEGTKDG